MPETLLGAAATCSDGPVTLVPTGRLHAAPSAMLQTLTAAFDIVPSAGQSLRPRGPTTGDAEVLLLAAPGLAGGGADAGARRAPPRATLLDGADATVEQAMAGPDGATLAHVAATRRFRPDSPLFLLAEMADGPLTVHDLERLKVAPYRPDPVRLRVRSPRAGRRR